MKMLEILTSQIALATYCGFAVSSLFVINYWSASTCMLYAGFLVFIEIFRAIEVYTLSTTYDRKITELVSSYKASTTVCIVAMIMFELVCLSFRQTIGHDLGPYVLFIIAVFGSISCTYHHMQLFGKVNHNL